MVFTVFPLPVVTRFLWPPEIPLIISFPTRVSAQIFYPNIRNLTQEKLRKNHMRAEKPACRKKEVK